MYKRQGGSPLPPHPRGGAELWGHAAVSYTHLSEYCEDTLRRMEEAVADAYDEVKHSRAKFRSALSAASGGPAPRSQPAPRRAMYDAEADEDED